MEAIRQPVDDELLNKNAAAKLVGMTPKTISNWGYKGKLTRVKVGYSVRYLRSELMKKILYLS